MGRRRSRRRVAWAGARGATVVEYALIVALLVFGSLGAISQLDQKSGDYYEGASDDIGDLPQTGIDSSDDGTVPSTSSTTTTTAPARSTITELTDISSNDGGNYYAVARVRIRNSQTSAAINGASVTVLMVDDTGNTTNRACVTDSTGRCSVTWNVRDSRAPVTATVTDVSASPVWNGVQASVVLTHP